ncbi:MAG: cobalamin-dependent protein [Bacillota bacterium]
MTTSLSLNMADLKEDSVFEEINEKLSEGVPAEEIFKELQVGMEIIGERYQSQEYYLSELIMAADIFKKAANSLQSKFQPTEKEMATIVLGTVAGDIHDIGKDIVSLVFSTNGFKVIDLGVDVPISKFVDAVREHNPEFVGLSCLLTTAFDNMKKTIDELSAQGLRNNIKVLIGGGPVDQTTCNYVKADAVCEDAPQGVEIAKKMLGVK